MNFKWHFNTNTSVWKEKHIRVLYTNIYTTFMIDNMFKGYCPNIKSCVGRKKENGLKKMNGVCLSQPAGPRLVQSNFLERLPSLG